MNKIIFLDVDGTLVNYENQIPPSARSAIELARKNGHKVIICTGRSRAEIQPELWELGIDGLIGGNGSYVEYHEQVVLHQLIPAETAHRVVDWLTARGLEFYLESNNGLFASPNFEKRAEPVLALYTARKGMQKASVQELMHGIVFGGELYRDDLNKISFILNSYQDHLDSKADFPELEANTWGGVGETALFGDLGVKDIDKSVAISALLKYLNANQADTIALGDAKVDIPMLQYCAIGVAMGNGGEEIKAVADFVTSDVNDEGIYRAFEKLGLLQ